MMTYNLYIEKVKEKEEYYNKIIGKLFIENQAELANNKIKEKEYCLRFLRREYYKLIKSSIKEYILYKCLKNDKSFIDNAYTIIIEEYLWKDILHNIITKFFNNLGEYNEFCNNWLIIVSSFAHEYITIQFLDNNDISVL